MSLFTKAFGLANKNLLTTSPKRSTFISKSSKGNITGCRFLHLHEYQSQSLMKEYGINIPAGSAAGTPDEAERIAEALASPDLVVKAQILAGGRGLGKFDTGLQGGVHLCNSPKQVKKLSEMMLGHTLVTKQTGQAGKLVNKVYVCRRYFLRRECYIAILLDRAHQGPVIIYSDKGGMDIEKVAHDTPNSIHSEPINMKTGVTTEQAQKIAQTLGFTESAVPAVQDQIQKMYKFFIEKDATLLEINPFVETSNGEVMSVDAKVNFDDNAKYRQADLFSLEDKTQINEREVDAARFDLNYIQLDGNIGCLVNGAGLAMSTMDIIKLNGGSPANFLDIGGGATKQQVQEAIRILATDPKVKVILINIFGGIMRCDIIALGLISAVKELAIKTPLVVRLQGTNVNEAKTLMAESGLRIVSADDLDTAAQKAVKISQILDLAEVGNLSVSFELPI